MKKETYIYFILFYSDLQERYRFSCTFMRLGCVLKFLHNVCVSTTFLAFRPIKLQSKAFHANAKFAHAHWSATNVYRNAFHRFGQSSGPIDRNAVFRFSQSFDRLAPFVCIDQSNNKYLLDPTKSCLYNLSNMSLRIKIVFIYCIFFLSPFL